jgi:K+-sensing histidine kinase KdpD
MLSLVIAPITILVVTAVLRTGFHLANPTTAALCYLLVILITATASTVWVAIAVSVLADLCLNYFFMAPIGTFTIADAQNWVDGRSSTGASSACISHSGRFRKPSRTLVPSSNSTRGRAPIPGTRR